MGFLDKAINSTKAAIDASTSKIDDTIEIEKLESRIRDENRNIEKLYKEIGEECYKYHSDKDESHNAKIEENITKIDETKKTVEDLQKQVDDIKSKGKEKRDGIKAEADAKNKAIDDAEN